MACTTTQTTNQVLEAMEWSFGGRECRSTTFIDDTAGSLTDEYFDLNVIDEDGIEKFYYVLLSGTTPATDPAPVGKTKIEISYTDGDSKEVLAGLYVAALSAIEVNPIDNGLGVVEIENKFLGLITEEIYTNAPSLVLAVNSIGFGGLLGALAEGGASLSTSQELVTITADATGAIPLDEIMRGGEYNIEMPLVEMSTANWISLVGNGAGDNYKPASEILGTGFGTSKLFNSTFANAGQLSGHPIRLPKSDRSADISIWKTMPIMNDINYSGSEVQTANLAFKALKDGLKPDEVNMVYRGDHSEL